MTFSRFLLLSCLLIATSAFTMQPESERNAQNKLPQAKDDLWDALGKCKLTLDEKAGTYSVQFTPQVKAMDGKSITASGFMLPLEAKETFTHYILSKRTPTCPFCPPGEPNEIIEVFTKDPVKWTEGINVVTGTLTLSSDPQTGLFFHLQQEGHMDMDMHMDKPALPIN